MEATGCVQYENAKFWQLFMPCFKLRFKITLHGDHSGHNFYVLAFKSTFFPL